MKLAQSLLELCQLHAENSCWVAYSGGVDSRVLLDLCKQIEDQLPAQIKVIHVHHGLSAYADDWARHCAQVSASYNFEFIQERVQINGDGSPEELARNARYAVFADLMQSGDVLLTAHHQADQAETMLLQLLRGAGPKGLAAMPVVKIFSQGKHLRPLLHVSQKDILDYAHSHDLKWVEDESNRNRALTRNYLRHEIMPLLNKRWHNADAVIARSAKHCAESQELLEEAVTDKLEQLSGSRHGTLSVAALKELNPAWQRQVLRVWITRQGFTTPETTKIASIQQDVLHAAWDKSPCVDWAGAEVRRHRDDLSIVSPASTCEIEAEWCWDMTEHLPVEAGVLMAKPASGTGLKAGIGPVTVRFRRPGEKVEVAARGRLTLKNLFQEWQVPVWERNRVPLIFQDNKLIQAVGYFLDPDYAAGQDEAGLDVKLEERG